MYLSELEFDPAIDVHDHARSVLSRYAQHPSAWLAMNRDTRHFFAPGIDGMLAYRPAGTRHVALVAGIHAPIAQRGALLDRFLEWARNCNRRVFALQMLRDDAERFAERGFLVNQIGASYGVTLSTFKLAGGPFIKLRNKISRARRSGIEIAELNRDCAPGEALAQSLADIDRQWLKAKRAKELQFLIGEVGDVRTMDRSVKRLFVAMREGKPVAYILYTVSFGQYAGWMHDLTRRFPEAPTGVMEAINAHAIETFKAEGARMLNFGFTPLTSLAQEHELPRASHPGTAWVFRKLARHGRAIYPAADQLQYKLKWAPDVLLPEYVAFERGATPGSLWQFLRMTGAV